MPQYAFECRACKRAFRLLLRVSERATAKIRCPDCGSEDIQTVLQPFIAKTAKKS